MSGSIAPARVELSAEIARAILDGFDTHYRLFRSASVAAKGYFDAGDWTAIREVQRARIGMYDQRVVEAVIAVLARFPDVGQVDGPWRQIKLEYIRLLYEACHRQPECAETFFNSVARRLLDRDYHHNAFIFDRPAISTEHLEATEPTTRSYYPATGDLTEALRAILQSFELKTPFDDLDRDLGYLQEAVVAAFGPAWRRQTNFQVEILRSLFFRNKAAYVVGRILNGSDILPLVIPLRKQGGDGAGRLYVDAALFDAMNVNRVLSVGRVYFLVDMEVPSAYVDFLASIAPTKPRAELYTLVGLQKQGKTLFLRDLRHHLRHSSDAFVLAPGTRGMVMLVFTLPSYPYVFKIIRDAFEPPKDADRTLVVAKYDFVKRHDRAGRLADTLEFAHVALPAERVSDELLAELERLAPSQLRQKSDADGQRSVVLRHLYVERRLVPLNLLLENADDDAAREAIGEYGHAVRELAGANIFPGDLLFKNFGVTRFGRVVFYDYDELCELTECRFRTIPTARYEDDETSAEPWYFVESSDVFPEQFPTFLVPPGKLRQIFMELNGDLADARWWVAQQERVRAGVVGDDQPYERRHWFSTRHGAAAAPRTREGP